MQNDALHWNGPPVGNLQCNDCRQCERVSNFPNFSVRTVTTGGMQRCGRQNSNQIRRNKNVCPYFLPNSAVLSPAQDILPGSVLDGRKSAEVDPQWGLVRW